jgi:hypothetical protein
MRPSTTALAFGPAAALLAAVAAAAPPRGADVPPAGAPRSPPPAASAAPKAAPSASAAPKAPPPATGDSAAPAADELEPELHAEPVPIPSSPGDTEAAPAPSSSAPTPVRPAPLVAPVPHRTKAPEPVVEIIKPARDTLGGHFLVGVDAAMVLPFGDIASGIPQSRTMGVGLSLGGDVAYGISRTVMLGAYIDVGLPTAEGASSHNSIATIAFGPMIRYHLVQGLAFDPWISGGFGFRHTSDGPTSYTGVDWARIALGGDWYPASNFGFGPFVELSMGTFFSESPGTLGPKALDAHFVLGGRIVFDAPGR